jgi:hypothetical protein
MLASAYEIASSMLIAAPAVRSSRWRSSPSAAATSSPVSRSAVRIVVGTNERGVGSAGVAGSRARLPEGHVGRAL